MQTFKGRSIIPGDITGEALVSHKGFNVLASYKDILRNPRSSAACSDQNNAELYEKDLAGKVLCIPQVIGSTTAGLLIQTIAALDKHPAALLFSETIDSLALSGVLLADIWEEKTIVTVDGLGSEFLDAAAKGRTIKIQKDGTIITDLDGGEKNE